MGFASGGSYYGDRVTNVDAGQRATWDEGEWVPRVRIERLPNAGHFVQQEAAEEVSAILLRELRE